MNKIMCQQLLFAFLTIAAAFAVFGVIFLISNNAVSMFVTALLAEPLVVFAMSAISLLFLKKKNIYLLIVGIAVFVYVSYIFVYIRTFMPIALLESVGFAVGALTGYALKPKKQEKDS